MAILVTGNSWSDGDQVTAALLNSAINSATFASGAVDDSTTELNGSNQLIVKDAGITPAKLSTGAPSWDGSSNFTNLGAVFIKQGTETGQTANANANDLVIDSTTDPMGMTFLAANTAKTGVHFGDTDDDNVGRIEYDHSGDAMNFLAGASLFMRLVGGKVGIGGELVPDAKLHVGSLSDTTPTLDAGTIGVFNNSATAATDSMASVISGTSGLAVLNLGDTADENVAKVELDNATNILDIFSLGSINLNASSSITFNVHPTLKSATVAALTGGTAGQIAYASDGRKAGEGIGSGTGVQVFYDGSNWIAVDTGATVAA